MIANRTIRNKLDIILVEIVATMLSHLTSHALTFLIEGIGIKLHSFLNKCKPRVLGYLAQFIMRKVNVIMPNSIWFLCSNIIRKIHFTFFYLHHRIYLRIEITSILHS